MGSAFGTNFVPKSGSIWSLAAGFEACESENGGNETLPEAPARCAVGARIHTSSCVREGFVGPEFRYHRTCGRGVLSELLAAASIFSGRVGGFSFFFAVRRSALEGLMGPSCLQPRVGHEEQPGQQKKQRVSKNNRSRQQKNSRFSKKKTGSA